MNLSTMMPCMIIIGIVGQLELDGISYHHLLWCHQLRVFMWLAQCREKMCLAKKASGRERTWSREDSTENEPGRERTRPRKNLTKRGVLTWQHTQLSVDLSRAQVLGGCIVEYESGSTMWSLSASTGVSQCCSLLDYLLLGQLLGWPMVIVVSFWIGGQVIVSLLVGDEVMVQLLLGRSVGDSTLFGYPIDFLRPSRQSP